MSASQNISEKVDAVGLHVFVEDCVLRFRGNSSRLIRLDRKPHAAQSSFAIEHLNAIFEEGLHLQLILKDVSPTGMLQQARQVRPQAACKSSREIYVYGEILANAALGTAACYSPTAHGRRSNWLLLEKVEGEELYQIGDFDCWRDVARWLARMHDYMDEVARNNKHAAALERYDEGHCNYWIDRAMAVLRQRDSTQHHAISPAELSWLDLQCRQAAHLIGELPTTIVHGEFYASNILVERKSDQTRICPIDWETAGIGTGLIDVAALTAGYWSEEQKQDLAMAYHDALKQSQSAWSDSGEFMAKVNYCRLLLAMKWIGWCANWEPPAEHRFNWLQEAMHTALAIEPAANDRQETQH